VVRTFAGRVFRTNAPMTRTICRIENLTGIGNAPRSRANQENQMAERVTGPYRGYYISASARLTQPHDNATGQSEAPIYVGSVSLARHGPDDAHRFEVLVDLGDEQRFATEDEALAQVEQAARDYIDRLLPVP
jgi:hypothetical protein